MKTSNASLTSSRLTHDNETDGSVHPGSGRERHHAEVGVFISRSYFPERESVWTAAHREVKAPLVVEPAVHGVPRLDQGHVLAVDAVDEPGTPVPLEEHGDVTRHAAVRHMRDVLVAHCTGNLRPAGQSCRVTPEAVDDLGGVGLP